MFLAVVHAALGACNADEAQRSYFGVYRVILSEDGEFNV